jgi:ADP-ribose pyrophosphatase
VSLQVRFDEATGAPLNPRGRTGIRERGLLGKWGPNHAADPIVTRWGPDLDENGQRVLQMVAVKRKDTGDWAIPGGMVDDGEHVSATLRREFSEEAGAFGSDKARAALFMRSVEQLWANGVEVYRGYVDDPRNTDNAWMETTAFHYHCSEELGNSIPLAGGDDATSAMWLNCDPSDMRFALLYASHREWVEYVRRALNPHNSFLKSVQQPEGYDEKRLDMRRLVEEKKVSWHYDVDGYDEEVQEWTADIVKRNERGRSSGHGWADPGDLSDLRDELRNRLTTEGPVRFIVTVA